LLFLFLDMFDDIIRKVIVIDFEYNKAYHNLKNMPGSRILFIIEHKSFIEIFSI
jgi:hypothetical protein